MLFSDVYKEPANTSEASLRERGSRFLAFAYPVYHENEIREKLQILRQQYPDATHHCYAYVMNPDKSAQRANDDGEPSNSAGKPILRAILSADLTNLLVVVVRYFGGTQLGIPGLIQAYGDSARLALEQLKICEKHIEDNFSISCDFAHEQEIHRLIGRFQARVTGSEYSDKVHYRLAVRRSMARDFMQQAGDNYLLEVKND